MELHIHKEKFEKIVKKYKLDDISRAEKISKFLTSGDEISYKEFAKEFEMSEKDSQVFLSFILKGIKFKEEVIDPNNK